MDNLEQFFRHHKNQFDYVKADESGWSRLQSELDAPQRFTRGRNRWWWAAAASVLLVIAFVWFQHRTSPAETEDLITLIGLEENQYFPDLALRNPDGEVISLASLNAQVVLVDFWASYCMVCNQENCFYFKPLYDEFQQEGFEIYGVSVDSSAHHWVNAVQHDDLNWVHVSDLQGFDSPFLAAYDVQALPTNYLLDKNGKIIAKNINVEELEDRLAQLLAYQ